MVPESLLRPVTPIVSQSPSESQTEPHRDLSNRKLAQNQTELSQQISDLRSTVERQSEMMRQLLAILGDREHGKRGEMAMARNSMS